MSCNAVRASAFLLVLSVLSPRSVTVLGGELPKKAPPPAATDDQGDIFPPDAGQAPVKPRQAQQRSEPNERGDPFGDGVTAPVKPKQPIMRARPAADNAKPSIGSKLHGGEKAILKALKRKATLRFVETPLKDFLENLSDTYHIPIYFDPSLVKDSGVDEDTPITCNLSGISLQSALETVLDELQLKWTIHHEMLYITSPQKAESDDFKYTRCYDVSDLVIGLKDSPLRDERPSVATMPTASSGMGGMGGMGMGGTGSSGGTAASGGGFFDGGARGGPGYSPTALEDLKDKITSNISPKSWEGQEISTQYDRFLLISQTREIHMEIEHLLAQLRAKRDGIPSFTVELRWLWLDAKRRDELFADHGKAKARHAKREVSTVRLDRIASQSPGFHGKVTCLDGLGTSFAAGDRRALIASVIPVVDGDSVGHAPVINVPNVGVTAEIRPTLLPDTKSAMLNVRSTVARWSRPRRVLVGATWPPRQSISNATDVLPRPGTIVSTSGGSNSCPIDLPVMPTQEFGTTLRVPLGKPIVVGSVTFAPAGDAGLKEAKENMVEVYLIATVNVVKKK